MAFGFVNTVRAGAVALSVLALSPASAGAETLADALVSAYTNSGLLRQNRALLRAADEDVAATYALLRPIVNWSGSIGRSVSDYATTSTSGVSYQTSANEVEIGISAELLLYDNGGTKFAVEAAKESVLATREALVSAEQNILLGAVQAYMNVVRDAQIVELRRNNLRLVARELQAAKDRFEVGEVTRTDVALAESSLAGGRASMAVAQGNLMQSKEQFASAVGHQPGALVAPKGAPKTPAKIEDAKGLAVRSHPEMRRSQHLISAADWNVQRAESVMGPTVKLKGSYGVTRNLNSQSLYTKAGSVSVAVTAPIYQGGRLSALLRQSMANRDAQRAGLHLTRLSISEQAGISWASLASAGAQLTSSARQIEAARIAFEGVREEAKLGSRTTLDVLTAEQDLLNAESNRITAKTSEITAAYGLLASMGLLTADHLNLKVERYDPEAYYNMVKDAPALRSKRGQKLDKVLRAIGKE